MNDLFETLPFRPADILLPQNCDLGLWSVVACDQYTSQPEYWQRVEERVGRAPSSLRLILPESCLDGPSVETDIMEINNTMSRYLREERFALLPQTMIYVERTLHNGKLRRGLVGMVDLEQYDYEPGSPAQVRATEGTVLSRIPPRVAVRKNAPIELPHVMLLTDDPERTVIEPLAREKTGMEQVYDFDLMERGGHLAGWKLGREQLSAVAGALQALADPAAFNARYGTQDQPVLLFAVGDGNHSLATAKECYERQKRITPQDQWETLPSRYALAELVNLHDESLEFEPIHRVIFKTEPKKLLKALEEACAGAEGFPVKWYAGEESGTIVLDKSKGELAVGILQHFLDDYLKENAGEIDYIHDDDALIGFAKQENAIGFLLPAMEKSQLFRGVIADGVLPRKTFSMGHSREKRYYLEGRKIKA